MAGLQNPDHRFLALIGQDRELDFALLKVIDRVGDVALFEDSLAFFKFKNSSADPHFGKIGMRVELVLGGLLQYAPRFASSLRPVADNTLGHLKISDRNRTYNSRLKADVQHCSLMSICTDLSRGPRRRNNREHSRLSCCKYG